MFAAISHIDDIRELVERNSESFYIADKGDYLVANYKSIMAAFPDLSEGEDARKLRELRGIIFCSKTGEILRRPLHKFFNYGERAENHPDILDAKKIVGVYDKLDGSMVSPFILGDKMVWGTKMGLTHMTDDLHAFIDRNQKYAFFAQLMINIGLTPIFEYMAPKHRIVVNHDQETMVLLALRERVSGKYIPYENMALAAANYEIPVVRRWEIDDNKSLIEQVRELEGAEGVVIEYDDGTRVKVKSLWYVDLHKNREAIARERYVAGLILNDRVDDVMSLVPDFVQPRLMNYTKTFLHEYNVLVRQITIQLHAVLREKPSRKDFALRQDLDHTTKWIGFKVFDCNIDTLGAEVEKWLKDVFLRACGSDTDFNTRIRNDLLRDKLPEWNIWDGTTPIDE